MKIIVVINNTKREVGKTTLAMNLTVPHQKPRYCRCQLIFWIARPTSRAQVQHQPEKFEEIIIDPVAA